ncbi:type IV pilus biogenesis/stability protein PilW [Legionella oakridgensis]|uniref:Type IV pilus biogenesis/stability protein PilW n=2 Tax=Legionella oakridgensis TaxID=29423 RepID=W0BEP7_9GAMM|nr:type IV pilus biogenesis/stability protein PilW [Legionella oakridgensis]AHE67107.1 type IV pilus biogenesis/stability protein PilW [Legionella oakridgensis ATCC 33761 = DSM 21215]ETO93285.1 type IV pilus biogenesis/stability protein PilW [Legionella oakridgensis RV-2-2007]KTD44435.1 twitching motility protein PilF [Legionella oakridgensis]STY20196.1 twitching motility protein PilF [Legionella longbeachae]
MKFHYLLSIGLLLLLQACQQKSEVKEDVVTREYNRSEAASYNTQLGLAYLKQGNRPRAKRKLLIALSQAPDSPSVNSAMAYFMEKTGEIQEAKSYYQKALSLAPGSGAQLNNYGAFLCRQGQYNKAEEYFMKAVKDIRYENTAGAYENAGLCAMVIPNYTRAKEYFIKALEQDSSRKQSLYELVTMSIKQDQQNEALAYLQKYPNLSLRDHALLSLAAEAAHKAGKIDLEADYRARLQQLSNFSDNTGEKHAYNNDNG